MLKPSPNQGTTWPPNGDDDDDDDDDDKMMIMMVVMMMMMYVHCMYVCITFISDSAIQNNIVIQCWGP